MATPARACLTVTELPGRVEAEAELRSRFYSGRRCYAAIVTVQHLELVERYFGTMAAGSCLSAAAARLSSLLHSHDRMFRWSGATLLLLLDREAILAAVAAEVRNNLRALQPLRLESSAVTLRCASSVFLLDDVAAPSLLPGKIELSVASAQSH